MPAALRPFSVIHAHCAGLRALQALRACAGASVLGSTSGGVFLLLPGQQVVLLSYEAYRSPLTLTLAAGFAPLKNARPGMKARIHRQNIRLPDLNLSIDLSAAQGWPVPAPAPRAGTGEDRRQRLQDLAERVLLAKAGLEEGNLLRLLLGLPGDEPHGWKTHPLAQAARDLRRALAEKDPEGVLQILLRMLGVGQGLTPAGDDLIAGLLLLLNRWPAALGPLAALSSIQRGLAESAYLKTTALSANLIELAAAGEADERLVRAADYIFSGQPGVQESAAGLASYGSSSGAAALAGMAAVVLS